MSYVLIKNNEILCFSDKLPIKYIPGIYENIEKEIINENGEKEIIIENICIKDPIDGVDFDKSIKIDGDYDYRYNYEYIDGSINVSIKDEFNEELIKQKELEKKELRKTEILFELGELKTIKDGLEMMEEDTTEIDKKISDLKAEYKNILK